MRADAQPNRGFRPRHAQTSNLDHPPGVGLTNQDTSRPRRWTQSFRKMMGYMILYKKNFKLKLSWYWWGALAIALLFTIVGARWLWLYRRGQALDIDEAGYLSIALSNYDAWVRGGPLGWLGAILAPNSQAPLTTDLASLVFVLTGPHLLAGFFIPLVAAMFCILATYSMGAAVGSRLVGLCASLLVASCPVMSFYSRSFHFGMAAALSTTAALLFMIRSNRFEEPRQVILFGLCLGLMPLSRSIDIAFMPGVIIAALFYILADPARLRKRLSAFAGALALAGTRCRVLACCERQVCLFVSFQLRLWLQSRRIRRETVFV